ncbi:MAG TPA: hypothetical protein PLW68_06200 [Casimicrobiaceae bacterium]|nr:hypothetical protein [Casimicrobiaceae bacterium]
MRTTAILACAAVAASAWVTNVFAASGAPQPRKENVTFAKGASSATIKGAMKGDADVDYVVRAAAGQTLAVRLDGSNSQNEFNVLPPGSKDVAMYVSGDNGERDYAAVLPADGDYTIRVYMNRAAARRHEASKYTLAVGVSGKPLPPLSVAKDAKVPGTAYHATAKLNCVPPFTSAATQCDAGVIRRGYDGTATLELRGTNDLMRRILFVQGKPIASDAADAMTYSRQGDLTVVKFGTDERYEVPDAFLAGG